MKVIPQTNHRLLCGTIAFRFFSTSSIARPLVLAPEYETLFRNAYASRIPGSNGRFPAVKLPPRFFYHLWIFFPTLRATMMERRRARTAQTFLRYLTPLPIDLASLDTYKGKITGFVPLWKQRYQSARSIVSETLSRILLRSTRKLPVA